MLATNSQNRDRFWRTLAIVLTVVMAANIALGYLRKVSALPDPPAVQVRELVVAPNPKLDRVLPSIDFDGEKFERAMGLLAQQADLNLVMVWKPINDAGVDHDVPVSMHLKNVTVATALDTMLLLADPSHRVVWTEHGGVVTIAAIGSVDQSQLSVRIYDVKHLMKAHLPTTPAPNPALQNAPQGQTNQAWYQDQGQNQNQGQQDEQARMDELKKFITDNVVTNSWKDNGGDVGSISSFGGDLLIITQTEQAQEKVAAFLQLLDRK